MHVVTVLLTIHAAHWDAFLHAMTKNAQASLQSEVGCRQFDVCLGQQGSWTVFLYEVYDTAADFDLHLASPHFLQFNTQTAPWVVNKQVRVFTHLG